MAPDASEAPRPWRRALIASLAIVAPLLALRAPNGFTLDDWKTLAADGPYADPSRVFDVLTTGSLALMGTEGAIDTWRPLSVVGFVFELQVGGGAPWPSLLTNALAHLLATALVFALVRRWVPDVTPGLAGFAAVAFAVHPAAAEAHVWINGRADLFAGVFVLATLLALGPAGRPGFDGEIPSRPAWGAGAALLVACLCKESALLLAIPLIVTHLVPRLARPADALRVVRWLAPTAAAAILYLIGRSVVLGGAAAGESADWSVAIARFGLLYVDALFSVIVPHDVGMRVVGADYADASSAVLVAGWIGAVAMGALAFAVRRRAPLVTWWLVATAAWLAPIAMIAAVQWPGFGRYLYLSHAFAVVAFAGLAVRALAARPERARLVTVAVAVWCLVAAALLVQVTATYRDLDTFTRASHAASPTARYTWAHMGRLYAEAGDYGRAIPLFEGSLEAKPGDVGTRSNLGWALIRGGRGAQAAEVARVGLQTDDLSADARADLLHIEAAGTLDGDVARAADAFAACLALQPDGPCAASIQRVLAGHPRAAELSAALTARGVTVPTPR